MTTSSMIVAVSVLIALTAFMGMSYRTRSLSVLEAQSVHGWPVTRLRGYLEARGLRADGFAEKSELVQVVRSEIISERDSEFFVGYTLLLLGYVLFPALGIALVQRLQERRASHGDGFFEEELRESVIYNPLPHSPLAQTRHWFGRAELQALVNSATAVYSGDEIKMSEDEQCIVCLGDMRSTHKIRELRCGHRFHVSCCDAWLIYKRKNWCPLCTMPVLNNRDDNMNPIVE